MAKSSDIKILAGALLALTEEATDDEALRATQEFARYLKDKGMLAYEEAILAEYRKLYNDKHGIIEATVTLSQRLPERTRLHLREALKKKYGAREVHILEKVDQRLIGGMRIKVGDEVFDDSVKKTLANLEEKLTDIASH